MSRKQHGGVERLYTNGNLLKYRTVSVQVHEYWQYISGW